jgi:KUP system potassium uptake protein
VAVDASQAVISGAFSVSREAVRLGYLPHLTVRQGGLTRPGHPDSHGDREE